MRVLIHNNYINLCKWTAGYISEKINNFDPAPEKPFVIGLPTGSSPLGVYAELINLYKQGSLSFRNVIAFNMDEYVGISESNPQSFHFFMDKNLFNHIDIPRENINILNGNAPNLEKECLNFEEKIEQYGGIHLFLGGTGINGHIAFNEPGSDFQSKTRVVTLTPKTLSDNSRFFNNDVTRVPARALTVGIDTIMEAKELIIIIYGKNKAHALQKVIEEGVDPFWPVSVIKLHQHATIVCDKEATAELKAETVNYYIELEKENR
jgi:glucosamine-6-phosphate deaminase